MQDFCNILNFPRFALLLHHREIAREIQISAKIVHLQVFILVFSLLFGLLFDIDLKRRSFSFQRDLAEEAVTALEAVHGTVFDPINSADLCRLNKNCKHRLKAVSQYNLISQNENMVVIRGLLRERQFISAPIKIITPY